MCEHMRMCLTVYAHVNSYEHHVPRRNIIVRRRDQVIYTSCQPPLSASCFISNVTLSLSQTSMSVMYRVPATRKLPAPIPPSAASRACATLATVEMDCPVQVKPSVCGQAVNTHV